MIKEIFTSVVRVNLIHPVKLKKKNFEKEHNYIIIQSFISGNEEISHSLVFVKDTSDLILRLIKERGLNPYCTVAKISVDAGHGFLKCIVNVFNPSCNYTTSENLDILVLKDHWLWL